MKWMQGTWRASGQPAKPLLLEAQFSSVYSRWFLEQAEVSAGITVYTLKDFEQLGGSWILEADISDWALMLSLAGMSSLRNPVLAVQGPSPSFGDPWMLTIFWANLGCLHFKMLFKDIVSVSRLLGKKLFLSVPLWVNTLWWMDHPRPRWLSYNGEFTEWFVQNAFWAF